MIDTRDSKVYLTEQIKRKKNTRTLSGDIILLEQIALRLC